MPGKLDGIAAVEAPQLVPSTSSPNRSPAPSPSPTYPIITLAGCKSSNLIYQLQCKKCKAFYIGETGQMLSNRVNGHCCTCTFVNSDLPVPIHTQSHQLPFQECWSVRVIHKLPDTTPNHVRHQHETAYQLVLKSHQFPGINIQ